MNVEKGRRFPRDAGVDAGVHGDVGRADAAKEEQI